MKKNKKWDGQRETLEDLSSAVHYNRWIYNMLRPYVGRRILEIGCGTGNLTGHLASHGRVLAVDVQDGYLNEARTKWRDCPEIRFKKIDLEKSFSPLRAFHPDTLICVNVLEHLSHDHRVLDQCSKLLPPGGKLLLFVPALQCLYGTMDKSYGHFRRYSLGQLKSKVEGSGFQVEYCRYLNLLGILGWWLNGKVLGRKIIPKSQMMLYDRVVSVSSLFERFLPKPIGLSLFCVGVKKKARS